MGKSTIIGIFVGFGAILLAFTIEKGNIVSLLLPSPAITVFGGTLGALFISYSLNDVLSLPKLIGRATKNPPISLEMTMNKLLDYATIAKREGLLALEKFIGDDKSNAQDQFLQRGLTLLMDSLDRESLKSIMDSEIDLFEQAKKREISIFESAGGFSPTMGVIGTVMGLVQVLSNMGTPSELAAAISVAFIATFYGVCFANLLWIPIANKLKLQLKVMVMEKEMIIEGVLSINELDNPAVIREKLIPFVSFNVDGAKASKKEEAGATGSEQAA